MRARIIVGLSLAVSAFAGTGAAHAAPVASGSVLLAAFGGSGIEPAAYVASGCAQNVTTAPLEAVVGVSGLVGKTLEIKATAPTLKNDSEPGKISIWRWDACSPTALLAPKLVGHATESTAVRWKVAGAAFISIGNFDQEHINTGFTIRTV